MKIVISGLYKDFFYKSNCQVQDCVIVCNSSINFSSKNSTNILENTVARHKINNQGMGTESQRSYLWRLAVNLKLPILEHKTTGHDFLL